MTTANLKVHFIDRDAAEKYAILFTGDASDPIEAYSLLDGAQKTVTYQDNDARDYAVLATPRENIKCITIGDYTLVANSLVTPAMTNVAGGTWHPFAIANVLHGVAGTDYKIYLNGVLAASFSTGDTTAYTTYKTSNIASELYNDIVTWVALQSAPEDWQVVYGGSSILINNLNDDDFTFKVEDSWGNAALVGIKEQAPKLEDLPNRLPDSSTYAADIFSVLYYQEYEMNVLMVGDPDGIVPGPHVSIGWSVSSFGHGDSSAVEAAEMWRVCLVNALQNHTVWDTTINGATRQTTSADQWHSDNWVIEREGAVVTAYRTDGVRSPLYVVKRHYRDGNIGSQVYPNDTIVTSRHEVVDFTDMAVKIYGEGTKTDFMGYYLRWKTETKDGMHATGTWSETVKGGLYNVIEGTVAPHQLVRAQDGTFSFGRIAWEDRKVGDMDSAPNPSWIGNPINDVFFHKNRVGFLAGGHVILSKSDDYWNFFPTTALEILDDDPIDITIPSTGVDALRWAIPNKGDLLIFGPSDEFILTSGDQVFGVKTASMDSNVNFPISELTQPIRCGANVYFISPKGEFAAIHEYFTQPQTLTDDAADVAAHCPKYVPYDMAYMAGSSTFNMLFMCSGDGQTIYCYKYYWAGDQKAQSAWFKWTYDYYIKAISVIDNYLYIIGDNGTEYTLERTNLERVGDGALTFGVCLDHKTTFEATGDYNAGTGLTTWTLPHHFTNELLMEPYKDAGASDWCLFNRDTGKEIDGLHWTDDTHVHVLGDYSAINIIIGLRYAQTFTFSEFGVPAPKGNVYSPQGRLQLRTLNVSFKETPMFEVIVTPTGTTEGGRSAITHDYSGVELGLATLGSVQLTSARKRFLIWANAIGVTIQLRNTSPYPATWYEASWEGYYTTRNQGIA